MGEIKTTFKLPALSRLAKEAGIKRNALTFRESLDNFITSQTRTLLSGAILLLKHDGLATLSRVHVITTLQISGIHLGISMLDGASSLKPINSRKKKKKGDGEEPKSVIKKKLKESQLSNRLLLPKKNFDKFCQEVVREVGETKIRFESDTLQLLQFIVEKKAILLCSSALLAAIHAERETVTEKDISFALALFGSKSAAILSP